jgi:hypothetical protein
MNPEIASVTAADVGCARADHSLAESGGDFGFIRQTMTEPFRRPVAVSSSASDADADDADDAAAGGFGVVPSYVQ